MEILSSTKHTKKKRTREKRFRSTTRTTTTSLAAANAETASLLSLLYIYICIDNSLLTLFSSENFLCVECERKKSSKIFLFFEFFSQKSVFFFISVKHTNP